MGSVAFHENEIVSEDSKETSASPFSQDLRWLLVERIAQSEPFQKSTRLPALLLYLAKYTLIGDRHKLTEQMIGQAVFGKPEHYNPAADSSVRVYVRQLRLRLHEYYHATGQQETIIVSVPKGGYALDFSSTASPALLSEPIMGEPLMEKTSMHQDRTALLKYGVAFWFGMAVLCAIGWYRAYSAQSSQIPWPLNGVIHQDSSTTMVLADAGFALRMLGNQEVPLDRYIDRSYLQPLLPKHMSEGESIVLHYFDSTRITSEADAYASAVLSSLAVPYASNLIIGTAKDLTANDLTHGDFIFVGSKTSNPWVELLDERMNFQIVENGPHGSRYLVNRKPLPNEQSVYRSSSMGTLASGDDYAVIALLPAKSGNGNMLLLEGVRMEGTKAAIALLQRPSERLKLQEKLASANDGQIPPHFEALLHAQSIGGATFSVEVLAVRPLK